MNLIQKGVSDVYFRSNMVLSVSLLLFDDDDQSGIINVNSISLLHINHSSYLHFR